MPDFPHSCTLQNMKRATTTVIMAIGLSQGLLQVAGAAQAFGVKAATGPTFWSAHPFFMIVAHVFGVLLGVGICAVVLASITRKPGNL